MKAIAIKPSNATAIHAALDAINGKASAHCFTTLVEFSDLTGAIESKLVAMLGGKKHLTGAEIIAVSGDRVSNAYAKKGHTRAATKARLERRATGWFLTDVQRTEIYQEGGYTSIILTPEQDALAIKNLRTGYDTSDKINRIGTAAPALLNALKKMLDAYHEDPMGSGRDEAVACAYEAIDLCEILEKGSAA